MSNDSHEQGGGLLTGTAVFSLLLIVYYGTVVLSGLHFAVLQVVTLWGIVLFFLPAYRRPLARSELVLLLSVTIIFLVALLSYVVNGLWNHPEANISRYVRFLFFLPIYLVARYFAVGTGFWAAILMGALATGVWGLLEFADVVQPKEDIWTEVHGAVNPIQFGDLSLAMAVMACAGLPIYRQWGTWILWLAGLAVLLASFACLASNTRGAWIAVPALVLLLAWSAIRNSRFRRRTLLGIMLTGLLFVAFVVPRTDIGNQVGSAVQELRDYRQGKVGPSVGARLELWRASWEVFRQHPVLGVGPGLYQRQIRALMADRGDYDIEALDFSHPHSEYLFVLVTLGTLGVLSLGLLFLVPLYHFGQALLSADDGLRWLGLAGTLLIVGYLQFGLTEALLFQHATFLGFYLLTVAVLASLISQRQRELMMENNA